MQITFCGAAQNVTGSCYHLDFGDSRLLVDCGMYQERPYVGRNWEPFPFDPAAVESVLLTHAHIDHIGRLPLLVKAGFRGRVICTKASADLVELLLLDSAHIQEEDARFKTKRHRREGRDLPPAQPLYTADDVEAVLDLVDPVDYHREVSVAGGVSACFNDAGHMLGSSHIRLKITRGGGQRHLVFSGDVGVENRVILKDPEPFDEVDWVVCESTYGDRLHEDIDFAVDRLRDVINTTLDRGGNVVIPSFAVGRTQTLLYYLRKLILAKQIPPVTTFVDSPMAVKATEILRRHRECYDDEARALVDAGQDPVDFAPLHFASTTAASKGINRVRGCVIIAASGMCNAGRIKHHLYYNLERSESTILFVGYQAEGTLGRHLIEGADEVRLFGEHKRVRARIENVEGLSGHADRDGLLRWLKATRRPPEQVFVTHGDSAVTGHFADAVRQATGWNVTVPAFGDVVELA